MFSRTYRTVVAAMSIVTEFPVAGLKTYPLEGARSEKLLPLVLPCTERVCVLVSQPVGSFRTSLFVASEEPRSAWIHWGKALLPLSQ